MSNYGIIYKVFSIDSTDQYLDAYDNAAIPEGELYREHYTGFSKKKAKRAYKEIKSYSNRYMVKVVKQRECI